MTRNAATMPQATSPNRYCKSAVVCILKSGVVFDLAALLGDATSFVVYMRLHILSRCLGATVLGDPDKASKSKLCLLGEETHKKYPSF